jgi:ribonucleoside-diphosphate reductase alpha chain
LNVEKKKDPKDIKPELLWGERRRLPQTRQSLIHKFDLGSMEFYLHVGLYDDGTIGEIFFTPPKRGSTIDGLLDSWAVSVSCALQSGMPLEALIDKYRSTHFAPDGFCGGKYYTSIADYVFRWLDERFVHPTMADINPDTDDGQWVLRPAQETRIDGNLCPACGEMRKMVGNKCFICGCGQSGGCGA